MNQNNEWELYGTRGRWSGKVFERNRKTPAAPAHVHAVTFLAPIFLPPWTNYHWCSSHLGSIILSGPFSGYCTSSSQIFLFVSPFLLLFESLFSPSPSVIFMLVWGRYRKGPCCKYALLLFSEDRPALAQTWSLVVDLFARFLSFHWNLGVLPSCLHF